MVKHEGTLSVLWGAEISEQLSAEDKSASLARYIKIGKTTAKDVGQQIGERPTVAVGAELDKALQGAFTRRIPKPAGARRCLTNDHLSAETRRPTAGAEGAPRRSAARLRTRRRQAPNNRNQTTPPRQ